MRVRLIRRSLGCLGLLMWVLASTSKPDVARSDSERPFKPVLVVVQSCGFCFGLPQDSHPELLFAMDEDGRIFRQEVKADGPFTGERPRFKILHVDATERDALLSEVQNGLAQLNEKPEFDIADAPVFGVWLSPPGSQKRLVWRYAYLWAEGAFGLREPALRSVVDRLLSVRGVDEQEWRPQVMRFRVVATGKSRGSADPYSIAWPDTLTKPSSDNAVVCMDLSWKEIGVRRFVSEIRNRWLDFDRRIWEVRDQWIDLPFGTQPQDVMWWASKGQPVTDDC